MRDELLIGQVKRGNKEAMQQLIEQYYDDVYHYCYHQTGGKELAQDITQETFYKMFLQLKEYRHYGKFLNYLYVIAGNLCRDYFKKHKPVYMEELPEVQDESGMGVIDERILMEQEIKQLPSELREVILLRFYQNRKIRDIAKIQGVSTALIQYRLKKALDLLKEQIKGEGEK